MCLTKIFGQLHFPDVIFENNVYLLQVNEDGSVHSQPSLTTRHIRATREGESPSQRKTVPLESHLYEGKSRAPSTQPRQIHPYYLEQIESHYCPHRLRCNMAV